MFHELTFKGEFEGIWASSSLLHVPGDEFAKVLNLLKEALKDNGVLYYHSSVVTSKVKETADISLI